MTRWRTITSPSVPGDGLADRLADVESKEARLRKSLEADRLEVWRSSKEYRGLLGRDKDEPSFFMMSGRIAALFVPFLILLSLLAVYASTRVEDSSGLQTLLGAVTLTGLFLAATLIIAVFGMYNTAKRAFYDRIRAKKAREVDEAVEALKSAKELQLSNLFALNRRQLDEYHVISIRQQNVAFRNAQVAGALGFLALIAGAVIVLTQSGGTERWLSAGLSGLGATLSGYIASVFFKQSSETSRQLQEYYREPARTGLILTIERLAALDARHGLSASDAREVRKLIVGSLLKHLEQDGQKAPTTTITGGTEVDAARSNGAA